MQRMDAALIIALTLCIVAATDRATRPPQASAFSIVLRLVPPALPNHSECTVTIRIGTDEISAPTKQQLHTEDLAQFFESLREAARDALFKQLRMA